MRNKTRSNGYSLNELAQEFAILVLMHWRGAMDQTSLLTGLDKQIFSA